MEKNMHVVYWIHNDKETDINTEGYVGVSGNFSKRLAAHKSGYGNKFVKNNLISNSNSTIIEIIFEGEEQACYDIEFKLRSNTNIGWNISEGGSKPPSPKGNKQRALKASSKLKGRKITWGDKISKARKGKSNSPESIKKAVDTRKANGYIPWNKGKQTGPQSLETVKKRSVAMKGKNSRKVLTPLGKFNSITEAAAAHNLKTQTIHARISKYKMEGYSYVE